MTTEALIFMAAVWAMILAATAYSFAKLLTSERQLDGEDTERPAEEPEGEHDTSEHFRAGEP